MIRSRGHNITQEKNIVNLEELMLQEENRIDEEMIDVESDHKEDKSKDNDDDDVEILGARFRGLK